MRRSQTTRESNRRDWLVAVLFVTCMLLVAIAASAGTYAAVDLLAHQHVSASQPASAP